jgi:ribonuclease P protein component
MRFRPGQHLRRQSDILAVREAGSRLDCGAFTLWHLKRNPAKANDLPISGPRLCAAASIAAVGHAVLRNRAKRRLREIFRRHQDKLPPDCDLLMVARGAVNRWPFPALERKFVEACARIASSETHA